MSASLFGSMVETVTMFLDEMELKHVDPVVEQMESGERQFIIGSAITLDNGEFIFYICGDEVAGVLSFYIQHYTNAPEEQRAAIAEFITRVNYSLWVGNFAMDYDDGEITFKASLYIDGISLGYSAMRNLLYCCFSAMERIAPAVEHLISGESTIEKALAEVEAE